MPSNRTHFILTPQLVWARCENAHQLALWSAIKMVAGEEGTCILGTRDLAALAMLGTGTTHQAREDLLRLGLLQGELCRDPGYPHPVWHLRIPDLWGANRAWREAHPSLRERIAYKAAQKERLRRGTPEVPQEEAGAAWPPAEPGRSGERERSPGEQLRSEGEQIYSEGERICSEGERSCSEGEPKKNPVLDPKGKQGRSLDTIWENALAELAFQFPRATVDHYLRPLRPGGWQESPDGARAVLLCPTVYVQEWCRDCLDLAIQRVLGGILGRPELAIEYRLADEGRTTDDG